MMDRRLQISLLAKAHKTAFTKQTLGTNGVTALLCFCVFFSFPRPEVEENHVQNVGPCISLDTSTVGTIAKFHHVFVQLLASKVSSIRLVEVEKKIMDFLFCSPSSLPEEHACVDTLKTSTSFDPKSSGSVTPSPSYLVESSCSEQSESSIAALASSQHHQIPIPIPIPAEPLSRPIPFPKAGSTSPSAVCVRRKLSTAIVTTEDVQHPVLEGRPVTIVSALRVPELPVSSTPPRKTTMAVPRSAPPKAPRCSNGFGLPRPSRIQDVSATTTKAPTQPTMSGSSSSSQKRSVAPLPTGDAPKVSKPVLHRATSAPVSRDPAGDVRTHPHSLRLDAWTEPAAETFKVRGPNYLNDRAKAPSQEAAFRLLTVDMIQAEKPIYTGMCAHPQERIQLAMQRERETGIKELPSFIFAINLCVPGDKAYHQVSYFGVDKFEEIEHPKTPFGRLMHKFIFGESDEFRNKTFKLIPKIVEGNFVVRKAVGSKPTILGRKIKHYYIRGPNYFEVIVDIASDPVAQRIVKLVLGYTKTLVVDMMFLLEGAEEAFLPERVFGGVRLKNIDLRGRDGKRLVEPP